LLRLWCEAWRQFGGAAILDKVKILSRDIYHRFVNDDGFPLAGNIAYCTLLSLFPFLIFLTALSGFLGDEKLATTVVDYLLATIPQDLVRPLSKDIHTILTEPDGGLLTLSIAFTVYSATGGVESMRTALNRAYGYTETRPYYWRFVQSMLFVVIGAVVLIALAVLIIFGPIYWSRLEIWIPALAQFTHWFELFRHPVGLGLFFTALMLGHLFLPVRRQAIRDLLPGVVATVVLWLIAAAVYADYIGKFSRITVMYAGLANVIIALIFLYISAALFILGGEINQSLISQRKKETVRQE
jgi:membrane protein